MLSVWLSALAGGFLYFALHLTASGSFPRPLTAAQERECLQKIKEGDQQARDYFIEHNLRLVAHIIKKYYASTASALFIPAGYYDHYYNYCDNGNGSAKAPFPAASR